MNITTLQRRADEDTSQCQINNLFSHPVIAGKVVPSVIFFDLTDEQKAMVSGVHQLQHSAFFREIWRELGARAARKCHDLKDEQGASRQLDLTVLFENVWQPGYNLLTSFCTSFLSGRIPLKTVMLMLLTCYSSTCF